MFESAQNPLDVLKDKLSQLKARQQELQELASTSEENIDVELGSEEYKDFGYTEELRNIETQIIDIERQLNDADDASAAQRNLVV